MIRLPVELQEYIFSFLSFNDIVRISNRLAWKRYDPKKHHLPGAIFRNHLLVVKWLCQNNLVNRVWESDIFWCIQNNYIDIYVYLVEHYPFSINFQQSLNNATLYGSLDIIKYLIPRHKNLDINKAIKHALFYIKYRDITAQKTLDCLKFLTDYI